MEQIFIYVPFGIVILLLAIYVCSKISVKRKNKNLIDIRFGETGVIDGKWYKTQKNDFGCVGGCAFFDPINGCSNHKVICSNPPRIYVEFEPYVDYDDYNDFEYIKWWEVVLLIVILVLPMTCWFIWSKILDLGIYIIDKIKKNGKRKKSSAHGCNQ